MEGIDRDRNLADSRYYQEENVMVEGQGIKDRQESSEKGGANLRRCKTAG